MPAPNLPKAPRQIGAGDPAAAWNEVLAFVADKPALSWIRTFALKQLAGGVARLIAQPGHREIFKFVTDQRREQLSQIFGSVLGSPVKIEIEPPASPSAANSVTTSAGPSSSQSALQQAMELPLVRQVMDLFDAQVVAVYPEGQTKVGESQSAGEASAADLSSHAGSEPSPFAGDGDYDADMEDDRSTA